MAVSDRTAAHIATRMKALGRYRVVAAQAIVLDSEEDSFPPEYMLAIALRESGLLNINNPKDSDKGVVQVSERYHLPFLRSEPGCPEGTWVAKRGKNAAMDNYCPRFTPAVEYAFHHVSLVGLRVARHRKVRKKDQLWFATTFYNTGEGMAMKGYKEGDLDKYSTGGDYGAWVLRHVKLIDAFLDKHPSWRATND